ncbi:MAG: hypothetical protein LBC08_03980 [Campylobacteraceae bacterium]|nr:hypothetical protein [Campylobacteraceae bacterium]
MLFYTPIVHYALRLKNEESDKIEFIGFVLSHDIFWMHIAAAALAFAVFLSAVFMFFQKQMLCAAVLLLVSLSVIAPYLMKYEKIFTFLFS